MGVKKDNGLVYLETERAYSLMARDDKNPYIYAPCLRMASWRLVLSAENLHHLQEASKMRNIHGIIKKDLIEISRLQMPAQLALRSKNIKADAIAFANRNLLMPSTFVLGQRTR